MTAQEAMDLAKVLFNEKGSGHFRAANLLLMLNMANRLVYRTLAQREPSYFARWTRITYTGGSEGYDMSSAMCYKTCGVALLSQDAAVSSSNIPVPLSQQSSGNIEGHWRYRTALIGEEPYTWQVDQKNTLQLIPIPDSDQYLYVRWVPCPANLSASDNLLLATGDAGSVTRAPEWHDAVVSVLLMLMEGTERGTRPDMASLSAWITEQMDNQNLGRTEHSFVDYDDPY